MKTLATDAVGKSLEAACRTLTPRMLMAYASVLGAAEDVYLDDLSGIQAFPPFVVVPEWDIMNGRAYRDALGADEATMWACIHVQQDSRFYKPIQPGMRLATAGKICELRATRIGTLVSTELTTTDMANGEVLARSWFSGIFLGHAPSDGDRTLVSAPALDKRGADSFHEPPRFLLDVSRVLPHLYTEAASIWNPIHTERRAARDSGLNDTLLHGTCTWASAGLALIREHAGSAPARLSRLAGRMAGQAMVGRRLDIQSRWLAATEGSFQVAFQVLDGTTVVLADGIAEFSAAT